MGSAATGLLEHLVPFQVEKFFVALGTPWKRVNAVEAENVVDSKKVKAMSDRSNPFPPPIESAITHCRPAVERNAPVLSPPLGELVVFEMRFRRRAAGPIERKLFPPGKHIRAVVAYAERNIAHQSDAPLLGMILDGRPLFTGNPLHVPEKILAFGKFSLPIRRLPRQPGSRG